MADKITRARRIGNGAQRRRYEYTFEIDTPRGVNIFVPTIHASQMTNFNDEEEAKNLAMEQARNFKRAFQGPPDQEDDIPGDIGDVTL